ncbi:uncharacterized protein HMPREF1541_03570 [Cyphellophora europaea CBS 101466]|uniref:AMP-dependent synthetase/ligase domain-containing protein n=1 Tax=Cyphellophora europaea (strain CBS 101466) TaxID=1220924 RepID=W2S0Z3_CYPE1|nr:uncharacterized protein HMPREF1541_03570 [Cyphellophora europaea CBS 101466]ETN41634.1 hypothetical protein HMPREF1541_03570 [Cyphellophora europaea CBS 101466]
MALIACAAAATGLAGMYLDAKHSIRSDIAQIRGARRMEQYMRHLSEIRGEDDWSFYHVLHNTYESNHHTEQEALVFEGRSWTYRRLREEIGRWAEALQSLGVRNRTVVGLFINNSPEFIFTWWALYKLGAIPAPINTSITGHHIKHCLKVSEAEFIITTFELSGIVSQAFDLAEGTTDFSADPSCPWLKRVILYDYNTYPSLPQWSSRNGTIVVRHDSLRPVVPEMGDFPKSSRPQVRATDASQYLFTSGTTGLPKALNWPAAYSLGSTCPGRYPNMYNQSRRFYVCLPMFHGTASFAALPPTHAVSGTIILARRFSRSEFWADVRRSQANAILYIGEMLRYLVQSPPDPRFPNEKNHGVDLAFGLGLSASVWQGVRNRFGIPWIVEYYSASEATVSLVNSNKGDRGVGKIAHWGPLMRSSWFGQRTFYIVRTDLETGDILCDPKTGFCMTTDPGEIGESISRIVPPVQRRHDYVGEGGVEATEKKMLRDVFETGDQFYRLGDALAMDAEGYVSFHDRLGDTYRAKGHNISTTEVEACFSRHPKIASVNVYAIPMNRYGYDGQLGCAALTFSGTEGRKSIDGPDALECEVVPELEKWLTTNANALPVYAVPRFLRVLVSTDRPDLKSDTGADRVSLIMKKLKTGLRQDGFSLPLGTSDRMYWIEKEGEGYVRLNKEAEERLKAGKARL